ncbi:MAG: lysylphosphatidylglycerol synthase transmembrane domain-containing protein [Candidatus Acidiferrales bacterium]
MPPKSRSYLPLVLAAVFLGFIVYEFRHSAKFKHFDWGMVAESLHHANISLLLLSIVAIYACYAIRALRWAQFSRTLGRTHFWNVYSGTLMGFACSFILGRPAEPVRPILIAKKDSLPVAGMFGVYFLERISDIAATVVLAGIALSLFNGHGLVNDRNAHLMVFAGSVGRALLYGLLVVIAFLVYFRFHGASLLTRVLRNPAWRAGWREKVVVVVEGFSEGLQGIRTWTDLSLLVLYTSLHWLMVALVYLWVARAFGGQLATLDFPGALLLLAFTMVGSVAQLPGVGGGAQASSILVFTLIFGVEQETAVTVSVVLWLISFASCCLVGVPLMLREGWSMGDLRRMVKEQERASEVVLFEAAAHPSAQSEERPH